MNINIDIKSTVAYLQNGLNNAKKFADASISKYGPRFVSQIDKAAQHLQKNAYKANITFFLAGLFAFGISKTITGNCLKKHLKLKASLILTGASFVGLSMMAKLSTKHTVAALASFIGGIVMNIFVSSMWCRYNQNPREL